MQKTYIELQRGASKDLAEGQLYDVNIMDFSKAFDHVTQHHHLCKTEHLGIQGPLLA